MNVMRRGSLEALDAPPLDPDPPPPLLLLLLLHAAIVTAASTATAIVRR
jgi:hypothetical protein